MAQEESSFKSSPEYGFKTTILIALNRCLHFHYLISNDFFSRRKPRDFPQFKANLLALYILLQPKIGYQKGFEELKELDAVVENVEDNRGVLTDEKALHYFVKLRLLIEKLGITKSEFEETSDNEMFTGAID